MICRQTDLLAYRFVFADGTVNPSYDKRISEKQTNVSVVLLGEHNNAGNMSFNALFSVHLQVHRYVVTENLYNFGASSINRYHITVCQHPAACSSMGSICCGVDLIKIA